MRILYLFSQEELKKAFVLQTKQFTLCLLELKDKEYLKSAGD